MLFGLHSYCCLCRWSVLGLAYDCSFWYCCLLLKVFGGFKVKWLLEMLLVVLGPFDYAVSLLMWLFSIDERHECILMSFVVCFDEFGFPENETNQSNVSVVP